MSNLTNTTGTTYTNFTTMGTSRSSSSDLTTDMDDAQTSPTPDGPESQSPAAEGEKIQTKKEAPTTLSRWTHIRRFSVMINVAKAYMSFNRPDHAAAIYKHVINGQMRVLGEDHIDTLQTMKILATIYCKTTMDDLTKYYREQERHDKSAVLFENILEIKKKIYGEENPNTISMM
ncbi:hypothetical protein RUND412_004574 [Rhizina undulata]